MASKKVLTDLLVDGNVGIGTNSPAGNLHIVGNTGSSGQIYLSDRDNGIGTGDALLINKSGTNAFIYNRDSGDLRLGTNNSSSDLVIDTGGNVGIGTTTLQNSSGYKTLSINGSTGGQIAFQTSGAGRHYIFGSATDFNIYNSTAGNLILHTNAAERMRIDANGNVGIGTASPSAKLDVAGDVLIDSGEYISWGTVGATSIEGSTASNKLQFRTSSTDRMIINDTGVGIGTTSPGSKLEIAGANSTTNATALFSIQKNEEGYGLFSGLYGSGASWLQSGTADGTTDYSIVMQPNGGNVGIGTTSPTTHKLIVSGGTSLASFRSEGSGQNLKKLSISTGGDRVVLDASTTADATTAFAFQTGGAEKMRITSAGKVGIGTTSPGAKLEIKGVASTRNALSNVLTINGGENVSNPYDGFGVGTVFKGRDYSNAIRDYGYIYAVIQDQTSSSTPAGDPGFESQLRFYTNTGGASATLPTQKMVINNVGNVGIGTASPLGKLHVSTGVDESVGNIEFFIGGTNGSNARTGKIIKNTSSPYEMTIRASNYSNGNNLILNDTGGNVGIGTTSPAGKLHVNAGTNRNLRITNGVQSTTGIDIQSLNDAANANMPLTLSGSLIAMMEGNVGIGTTNPLANLDILNGTTGASLKLSATSTAYWQLQRDSVTGNLNISDDALGNVMSFDQLTGNVGIGTTSPGEKLHVVGNTFLSANSAYMASYNNTNSYHGSLVWAGLQLGNNGVNRIVAGRTGVGGSFQFWTNNTNNAADYTVTPDGVMAMSILNTGNVGIGTTSPGAKLSLYNATEDVSINVNTGTGGSYPKKTGISFGAASTSLGGDAEFTGGAGIQAINTAASNNITDLAFWTTTGGSPAEKMRIQSNGNVLIGTAATTPIRLKVVQNVASEWACGITNTATNPYGLSVDCSANAGVFALGVYTNTGTGLFVRNDGKVGIGTDSPAQKLQVTSSTGNAYIRYNNASYTGIDIGQHFGGNIYYWNRDVTDQIWGNNSVERMRITSAGNVGIGTDNPSAKLEVKTSGFNTTIELDNSDTQYSVIQHNALGALKGFTGYNSGFMIYGGESGVTTRLQAGGAYAATILTNGNFGIGTTSPAKKLHVDSAGSSDIARFGNTSGNFTLGQTTALTSLDLAASNAYRIRQGSGTPFYIKSDGNVGIGNTNPGAKLVVGANIHSSATGIEVNAGTGGGNVLSNGTAHNWFPYVDNNNYYSAQDHIFRSELNGSTRMTIKSSGNVGIGDTTPSSKLSVNGGIQMADDASAASAANVGTQRYRSEEDYITTLLGHSYVDMCMKTSESGYEWVNIVTNEYNLSI